MSNQPHLEINQLTIRYQQTVAADTISLRLNQGCIACLLGPSGCGKTTILRTVAGFVKPDQGEIRLHGKLMANTKFSIATEQRNVGMVFQDFALFPHLTVAGNIHFGLSKSSAAHRKQRVDELLTLVGLSAYAKKYPHELSGGQQQRVALARAMAPRPQILLLDEPFSNIDIEQREQLAHDVRDIIQREQITTLLVTHDQLEAFAMADEIGVMHEGKLEQWDSGFNLYHKPKNLFVADFIGQGALINGNVSSNRQVETELGLISNEKLPKHFNAGDSVDVLIRPDDIIHDDNSSMTAEIIDKSFRGAEFLYTLKLPTGSHVLCFAPSHHNHHLGEQIGIRLEIDHLVAFKKSQTSL